jgi:transcriptional regulator with XRE-family HTH domain
MGYFLGSRSLAMNSDDLKAERIKRGMTQQEMADFLEMPVSTYRKWEQGERKEPIPPTIADRLNPSNQLVLSGLTLQDIEDLSQIAKEEGKTIPQVIGDFIRKGLKGAFALMLLGVLTYQVTHPEDQQARRFARGKRRADEIEMAAEA